MKKRLFSAILSLAMLLTLLPTTALAAEPASGSCGSGVTWSYDGKGTLKIDGSGTIPDYSHEWEESPAPWWEYRTEITTIIVGNNIKRIGNEAFGGGPYRAGYPQLASITIGTSVKEIGAYAFSGAGSITKITLPSQLTAIEDGAFYGSSLTEITIPQTVENIAETAFLNCTQLSSISVNSENDYYASGDGVLYEKLFGNKYVLICYPSQKPEHSYTILEGTIKIADEAFASNTNLTSIVVPNSVTEIPDLAFAFCSALVKVDLPDGIASVSSSAFAVCTALEELHIPASVEKFTAEYTVGEWFGETYQPLSVYFYGNKAPAFDGAIADLRDSTCPVTIYYPANATGWSAVQQQDNLRSAIENGTLQFKTWHPASGGDPETPPTSDKATILRTYPVNGADDVGYDASDEPYFEITFDRDISAVTTKQGYIFADLDFSKGSMKIFRSADDMLIYEVTYDDYMNDWYEIEGTISSDTRVRNGNTLVLNPFNAHTLLDPGTEYYITVDEGFVRFEDGTVNPAIQTGMWHFRTEAASWSGFTLGEDNNSYTHSSRRSGGFYGVKNYKLSDQLYENLVANSSKSERDRIKTAMQRSWGGSCFGIASTMALVFENQISLNDITTSNASQYYNLPKPVDDTKLLQSINYYQLSQNISTPTAEGYRGDFRDCLETLIQLLEKGETILFGYMYANGGHAILACGIEHQSNDSYLVQLYDENCVSSGERFIEMEIDADLEGFSFVDANGGTRDENTCYQLLVYEASDLYNVKPYSRSGVTSNAVKIVFPIDSHFTLTDADGRYLTYDGDINGTIPVQESRAILNENASEWMVTIPAGEQFFLSNIIGDVDFSVYSLNDYQSVSGEGIANIQFALGDTVTIADADSEGYTFEVYMSTDSAVTREETNLIKISGAAEAPVVVTYDNTNESISIESESEISNITANSLAQAEMTEIPLSDTNATSATVSTVYSDPSNDNSTVDNQPSHPSGSTSLLSYDITVEAGSHGDVEVWPEEAKMSTTVTITVTPDDGYELDELIVTDSKGNELDLTDKGSGKYTFKMPAGRVEIEASFKEIVAEPVNPFVDVSTSDYYYDAVLWAVENGVTNGTSATTFSPNMTVSRAQMVTFLWRAHGSPKATGANPFTDVSESAYYYDAVLWAVANGVTSGTSATTFSPDMAVTRAQAVTFQWRAAGSPTTSGNSFHDVATDAYYADAVTWAVANGITNGTGSNTFSPNLAVSRAQAVTFLYRELAD